LSLEPNTAGCAYFGLLAPTETINKRDSKNKKNKNIKKINKKRETKRQKKSKKIKNKKKVTLVKALHATI